MQFKRMLLMCSALISLAYSFPTDKQHNTTAISKNETSLLSVKDKEHPLVVVTEEKFPKSDSVVVQFVYTSNGGNSLVESTGSDKDKYAVNYSIQEEKTKIKSKEKENAEEAQNLNTTEVPQQSKVSKEDAAEIQMTAVTSLMPEEMSTLSGKLPKYLYIFNPIKPFEEMHNEKFNQINTGREITNSRNIYLPYYEKERKEPPFVAGPQLGPLSIYNREFNVPIFD